MEWRGRPLTAGLSWHACVNSKSADTPYLARVCRYKGQYVNPMAEIARVTVNWTGWAGAPGFTNLYFRDFEGAGVIDQAIADGAVAKVHTWLTAWLSAIHESITVTVDPSVEAIDETNGNLTAFWTTAPGAGRVGTGTGTFSSATGACVNWYTNGIRNARRIRGRSFMVPLTSNGFDNTGTLDNTKLTAWRAATATLIDGTGSGDLGVWSRPSGPAATDGVWYVCNAYTINDKAAILTSRRD